MLLIVGFVELIMMLHTYNVIADAAKEGVRYAIVHGAGNTGASGPTCPCGAIDGAAGTGVVKTYAQYSLHDTTTMAVNVDYTIVNNGTACNKSPCMVRVTVSYQYQPFFGLGWWPIPIPVKAAAQGRIVF